MSSPEWEYPDIEAYLAAQAEETSSSNIGAYEVPLGLPALGQYANLALDPAAYVIDPDYMEMLHLTPDELIKIRR